MTFFILWPLALLIGVVYFVVDRNAARKRVLFPIFMVGLNGALVVFLYVAGASAGALIFMTFVAVAVVVLRINYIRFCDKCGATVGLFGGFSPAEKCPKCDAPLQ
jgi:hypothetical protein